MSAFFNAMSLLLDTLSAAKIKYFIDDELVVSFRERDFHKVATPVDDTSEFFINGRAFSFTLSNKRIFVKPK